MDILKDVLEVAGVLTAAVSAFFAIRTYRRNANTKRAEFLMALHSAFFVEQIYRPVRDLLDNNADESMIAMFDEVIRDETSDLTDFLNFFELVAYFQACGTLRKEDVRALLGYYLDLMKANRALMQYIGDSDTSYEHLGKLLKK